MTETAPEVLQIDIDKVLKTRAPKIEKYIPSFLINAFKRFIHQEEMNAIIRTSTEKGIKDVAMAQYGLQEFGCKTDSRGSANIPSSGGGIVAANHPLGGLDGLAIIAETGKFRPDVKFIVNDILMNVPNFEGVFVGVNKHAANVKSVLAAIEKTYADDQLVLIFPAGLCSRKHDDGTISDLEWQKSFISRSLKYNLPVIPTHIKGKNSKRFYFISRMRKKLNIKVNLEMISLPDEMIRQKGNTISMTFGRPIPPTTFDKRKTPLAWAQALKDFVYVLETNPEADFEAFIAK
jgi:putative hemolysin